jgi:hypothetical protein
MKAPKIAVRCTMWNGRALCDPDMHTGHRLDEQVRKLKRRLRASTYRNASLLALVKTLNSQLDDMEKNR